MFIYCALWKKVTKLIIVGPMFIWNTRVMELNLAQRLQDYEAAHSQSKK